MGGINAGLMLIQPSERDYRRMIAQVTNGYVYGRLPFEGPEQEFLSGFHMEGFETLGIEWNYQLHHLAFCVRRGSEAAGDGSCNMTRKSK